MQQSLEMNLTITARIATWSARHRWWVPAGAVVVIALAVVAIIVVGTETRDGSSTGESGKAMRQSAEEP